MFTNRVLAITAMTAALLVGAAPAAANPQLLKSNVVIVRPHYHEKTRSAFRQLADVLAGAASNAKAKGAHAEARLFTNLAGYYRGQASSPGHGSGWVWMPPGEQVAYVVTNKHVAGQAASVTLEFVEDRHPAIRHNKVIYVDPIDDIAIVEVPRNKLPSAATGFDLTNAPLLEGNPIWAAGFPGTQTARGLVATYTLTTGHVSTSRFPMPDTENGFAIAHSATIDPGNSGGPLLVEVATAELGYRVAGINTWKRNDRSNVNLSIPASSVRRALKAAQNSQAIARRPELLQKRLRERAKRLAQELGSARSDLQVLNQMIAYQFVDKVAGPDLFKSSLARLLTGKMDEYEKQLFLSSPVEHTRRSLWGIFFLAFSTGSQQVGAVTLESITDEDRISTTRGVRSVYMIAGKRQEIVWSWEHGDWRISDATFEHARGLMNAAARKRNQTTQTTTQGDVRKGQQEEKKNKPKSTWVEKERGVGLAAWYRWTTTTANVDEGGFVHNEGEATSFGVDLSTQLSRNFGLVTGVAHVSRGTSFYVTVEGTGGTLKENVNYLQIPAMMRVEYPIARPGATVRLYGQAGVAVNVAIDQKASWGGTPLTDEWFEDDASMNVSVLAGAGMEVGFGAAPTLYLGLQFMGDRHMIDEKPEDFSNYRYSASEFGLYLKYQGLR